MDQVNIYIATSIKGLRAKEGFYGYVLQYFRPDGREETREGFGRVHDATEMRLELAALRDAMQRLTKSCGIRVFTKRQAVPAAISNGWVRDWKKAGWTNRKGEPVKNAELWQQVSDLLDCHIYTFEIGHHAFSDWQQEQMENIGGKKDV